MERKASPRTCFIVWIIAIITTWAIVGFAMYGFVRACKAWGWIS